MKSVIVYGLCSSQDGKIRYVGQTTQSLKGRIHSHLHQAKKRKNYHVSRWIEKTQSSGFDVVPFVIESNAVWNETEVRLIAWYKKHGANLVNMTEGGDGVLGSKNPKRALLNKSIEHRQLISEVAKKRRGTKVGPMPDWIKEKISNAKKGKKHSVETRIKMSMSRVGKPQSIETIQKRVAKMLGYKNTKRSEMNKATAGIKRSPLSTEHKTKISATNTGHLVSEETRKKLSLAKKNWWIQKTENMLNA